MSDEQKKQENQKSIQLRLKDNNVASGDFANSFSITFSDQEFVIDFIMMQPQGEFGIVNNRIILTPKKVNDLANGLKEAMKAWENINTKKATVQ